MASAWVDSGSKGLRRATLRTVGLLLGVFAASGLQAQPRAFFQLGTPSGVENRLVISRVPVRDNAGAIKYYDVALTFAVDAAGRLTLTTSATKITASPVLNVGAFRPGIYRGGVDSCEHVVGAPGVVGGGRVSGSIADASDCIFDDLIFNASWVTGAIAGHPNEAAIRAAGIAYQGYSWGIVGEVGDSWQEVGWEPGDVVGVVQSGQQLVIHNFGDDNREDTSAVFTLCSSCS